MVCTLDHTDRSLSSFKVVLSGFIIQWNTNRLISPCAAGTCIFKGFITMLLLFLVLCSVSQCDTTDLIDENEMRRNDNGVTVLL